MLVNENVYVCIDYNIEYAHPALIITIVVLFSGIITASVTLFHCYRKNIGVFGRKRREEIMEAVPTGARSLAVPSPERPLRFAVKLSQVPKPRRRLCI